ncbi:MAG: epoxyqueuosine reductase QueH [bacterium]
MNRKMNYNEELKKLITNLDHRPTLLLHSCCGPCSSYVINFLIKHFDITIVFYNPCIEPIEEYEKRKKEQIRLIEEYKSDYKIEYIESDYDNEKYEEIVKEHHDAKEGGSRCSLCFKQRLEYTSLIASKNNYEYYATTLTVSPHKNSKLINEIGFAVEDKSKYLAGDFKKEEGYKKSIILAEEYKLYRQNYCGCKYSKHEE